MADELIDTDEESIVVQEASTRIRNYRNLIQAAQGRAFESDDEEHEDAPTLQSNPEVIEILSNTEDEDEAEVVEDEDEEVEDGVNKEDLRDEFVKSGKIQSQKQMFVTKDSTMKDSTMNHEENRKEENTNHEEKFLTNSNHNQDRRHVVPTRKPTYNHLLGEKIEGDRKSGIKHIQGSNRTSPSTEALKSMAKKKKGVNQDEDVDEIISIFSDSSGFSISSSEGSKAKHKRSNTYFGFEKILVANDSTDITSERMFMNSNDFFSAIHAIQSEWGSHVREFNKEMEANAWKMEITTTVGVARAPPPPQPSPPQPSRLVAIKEDNPNNGR
jgi:hypothetical protein